MSARSKSPARTSPAKTVRARVVEEEWPVQQIVIGTLVGGVLLFLWGAIANTYFPWGVPSSTIYNGTTHNSTAHNLPPNAIPVKPHQYTTKEFETDFVNKVNVLVTDRTLSWITTRARLDGEVSYFVFEAINQLLVSFALTLMAYTTTTYTLNQRLAHFAAAAALAVVATYGQLYNWTGFTLNYVLGMSVNLFVSWVFVGWVLINFVFPSIWD